MSRGTESLDEAADETVASCLEQFRRLHKGNFEFLHEEVQRAMFFRHVFGPVTLMKSDNEWLMALSSAVNRVDLG